MEKQAGTGKRIKNVNQLPNRGKYNPKCNRTSRGQLLKTRAMGFKQRTSANPPGIDLFKLGMDQVRNAQWPCCELKQLVISLSCPLTSVLQ